MSKRVLVVDDDALVRGVVLRMLSDGGYQALGATDGAAALEFVREGPDFDLLMVDQRMPKLNGDDLIRAVWAIRPEQQVIRLLGNQDDEVTRPLDADCPALPKPFGPEELRAAVEGCIGKP